MTEMNMVGAINLALKEAMEKDEKVVVLGADVGVDEGVFRVTKGLLEEFGEKRVLDTPLAESSIIGTSIGMALSGLKPVCETQFSGFAYYGFHQLESHAARFRNRTRGKLTVPMVLRTPFGGGIRALEHHSESREAYYAHTPGLKIVVPSTPRKARALLHAAIEDPDPVIFYEPKALYRAVKSEVPDEYEKGELGKAEVIKEGSDITLVSFGASLHETLEAAESLEDEDGISCEVIDLVTISPLDTDTIFASIKKTGRLLIVHEGQRTCGIGAEIVARIGESMLMYLQAPISRVTGYDVPIPYFSNEKNFLPHPGRIARKARETVEFED